MRLALVLPWGQTHCGQLPSGAVQQTEWIRQLEALKKTKEGGEREKRREGKGEKGRHRPLYYLLADIHLLQEAAGARSKSGEGIALCDLYGTR